MSHEIYYYTCKEDCNRKFVMQEIAEHAQREGDGYHSRMTWHDGIPPLESEEAAHEFIKKHDNGWYDDHAVRFKDYSRAEKTAKIKEYETKISELFAAEKEYREAHSIHLLKARHIGCPKCESRLNKDFIRGENCPLCHTDLRSKTTLEKLEWYKNKRADYQARIEAEKRKQKCQITWLVKYEFHSYANGRGIR